ncbi:hypothetical protein AUEXF2481DRAFT_610943 [Aureobasidium subglaciale EXF-2481]|uniref:F-box domain-containing protein n=1 Tax=Aureobasidium subglaciale (strain EXF-2481) TaxID=1043005 RepID=A0A074ZDK3_AURSE|nr:uncharacterized protein AUEXF2481DRAFT_610943 [Aureobasidium subglaciale EXF-2481]KAI5209250.1 hypothetical protein E4T38_02498 [Aureobasidium subglaciale]KAI5228159.1 hypothetical protein E4T40_02277 [Aureobasidium subglaciale]KAI5231387.1 hypothetical protein E4T41_02497 [Aureobasidium subglaciale]KAI5265545.1 hypothetical protein E4T46_02275 [Aureobasidium subglaciale]KEQ96756.1 hypothetical protein AUEXF2481DRAFT_610943 [Aureobasidium subglaciale EXF-2481]
MGIALLSLPNEVLIGIIEHADKIQKGALSNLRLTNKSLEQVCHRLFLQQLESLRIDPTQKDNLTRLMDVISSPIHARAVKYVAFDFVRDWRNVWAVIPFVQELFDKLSALGVVIELKFSPYGSNEWISEPCIVHYIEGIVEMAAKSRLPVGKLIIKAKDWDAEDQLDKMLCRLGGLLDKQEQESQISTVNVLAVEFQHGDASYDRQHASLCFTHLTIEDFHQIENWTRQKQPTGLCLNGCQFYAAQLEQLLLSTSNRSHLLSRLTILNARLLHFLSFFNFNGADADVETMPIYETLSRILQCSKGLDYLHLEDIRTEKPYPRTLSFVGKERIQVTGNDDIRKSLANLMSRHAVDRVDVLSEEDEDDVD